MTTESKGSIATPPRPRAALILAGAAAKGPYAAGVLTRLAQDERVEIVAIAGASSGALNGAVFAAGLRVNQAARAAELLEQLWVKDASWHKILSWKVRKQIVLEALQQFQGVKKERDVRFRLVVATLLGRPDLLGRRRFEQWEAFETADFESSRRLDHLAEMAVASAALPVIFKPRIVAGEGPFWDGGIVDNAPIGWALRCDANIDHIIVVAPNSNRIEKRRYGRFAVSRLVQMLIEERLARDLREAESFNHELDQLDQKLDAVEAQWPAAHGRERLALEVRREMKWRTLRFLEIRPDEDLPGHLLSGFLSQHRRRSYVAAGQRAAERALAGWR